MAPVVLVHGFLVGPASVWVLDQRLQRAGFVTHRFSYKTRHTSLEQAAERLFHLSQRLRADTVHWVGHSLGGLVILKMFERCGNAHARCPPGRIVLLGSPVKGSMASSRLSQRMGGRWVLGEAGPALAQSFDQAPSGHPTTVIAGTQAMGLGALMADLPRPHDGTVAVAETELAGATLIEVPTSHSGLLISKPVSKRVIEALT